MRALSRRPLAAALLSLLTTGPMAAQSTEPLAFAPGADSATLEASVTGDAYRDYQLAVQAGQEMSVSLRPSGNAYFNVLPPGSDGEAIYIGSINGNEATVPLPASGTYTIRVYLMGNDRDSGATVPFTLSVTIP